MEAVIRHERAMLEPLELPDRAARTAGRGAWKAVLLVPMVGFASFFLLRVSALGASEPTGNEPLPAVRPAAASVPAGSGGEGILRLPPNAPAVDPMVAAKDDPFFPSRARTMEGGVALDMFTGAESCRECHTDIYAQWSGSMMAHAWVDPVYRAILERASVATSGAVDKFCIGCHTPIGLTTHSVDAQKGDLGTECSGVSCDVCHTISHITGTGNGSFVLEPVTGVRPVKYGPRDDAFSPFHDTTHSELHTRSEFCATCHNVTHPFNRLPVERTFDEWRDSPYNAAGVTCQDCHMRPAPGIATNPGRSAPDGKERADLFTHYFAGANVTMSEHFGSPDMAERARQMLRSAATIEFVDPPAELAPGAPLAIRVRVTNVGAGHKLPTGFPEGREVWVHFEVRDAAGNTLYEVGAIEEGHAAPGTKSYKAVLGDEQGNVVDLEVWKADRVLSDTRILPKGSALEEYHFTPPAGTSGALTLVAELEYASFSQELLDELLGPGKIRSEVVEMAAARHTLTIGTPVVLDPSDPRCGSVTR